MNSARHSVLQLKPDWSQSGTSAITNYSQIISIAKKGQTKIFRREWRNHFHSTWTVEQGGWSQTYSPRLELSGEHHFRGLSHCSISDDDSCFWWKRHRFFFFLIFPIRIEHFETLDENWRFAKEDAADIFTRVTASVQPLPREAQNSASGNIHNTNEFTWERYFSWNSTRSISWVMWRSDLRKSSLLTDSDDEFEVTRWRRIEDLVSFLDNCGTFECSSEKANFLLFYFRLFFYSSPRHASNHNEFI